MAVGSLIADHRFRSSGTGKKLESELTTLLQMDERWQVARIAIALSLGVPGDVPDPPDREGTEIRGTTLLRTDGSGLALLAMCAQRAGRALESRDLAGQVEAHWDRGLVLLHERVTAAREEGVDVDDVLLKLVAASVLQEDDSVEDLDGETIINQAIVGQEAAKEQIVPLLRDALEADPRRLPVNILFSGPRSAGKTLFAKTIAKALDLPFVDATGTTLRSDDDLMRRITMACDEKGQPPIQSGTRGGMPVMLYPPVIVFIDECHLLTPKVQGALLTALEPKDREAKTGTEIADLRDATFLLATTDTAQLAAPFVSRLREVSLEPYRPEEVAEIIRRNDHLWPSNVRKLLAMAGRLIPRQAIEWADDFDRFLRQERAGQRVSESLALEFMERRGVDQAGLLERDYRYLELLNAATAPQGVQLLASQLNLEPSEVEGAIEPFLMQTGLIERTPRGRTIKPAGKQLLASHQARGAST